MLQQFIALSETTAAAAETHNAGADTLLGLGVAGIGLVVVFTGLISLIFITWLYPKIIKAVLPDEVKKEKQRAVKAERMLEKKNARQSVKAEKEGSGQLSAEGALSAAGTDTADPALIAVITAAIAASMGTSTNGIVIKSLRRARPSLPAWGTSARIEQISNRL